MQSPQKRILEWFESLPEEYQRNLAILMVPTLPQVRVSDGLDRHRAVIAIHDWLTLNRGGPPQELGSALAFQAILRFLHGTRLSKSGTPEASIFLEGQVNEWGEDDALDLLLANAWESQQMWIRIAESWRNVESACLTKSKIETWLISRQKIDG